MKFNFLRKGEHATSEVSTFRLYTLRAMYLYMVVGLAIYKLPGILNPPPGLSNADSIVASVLGAFMLLAVLGLRYPVKMIPLLFMEFLFKFIWFVGWGPLTQELSPDAQLTLTGVLMGIILVPLTVPWGYLFNQYVKAPGDRWGKQVTVSSPKQPSSSPYEATTSSRA
jgi:peptidoglycan/LPS O-acetylase OafA/YrhL